MVKKFESQEDMLRYEAEREEFLFNEIQEIDRCPLNFYVQLFKRIFIPSYRTKYKDFDSYRGGYWADDTGKFYARDLSVINSIRNLKDGSVAVHQKDHAILGIYYMDNGIWRSLAHV